MLKKISYLIIVLTIIPFSLAGLICTFLGVQNPELWKQLMPAAINPAPGYQQSYTYISSNNEIYIPWDVTGYNPASYPNGKNNWIVLKENVKLTPGSYSGVGSFYAVDDIGDIYDLPSCRQANPNLKRCLDDGTIPWEKVSDATKTQLIDQFLHSTVLVESPAVWEAIRYRLGDAVASITPQTSADFFAIPPSSQTRSWPQLIIWMKLTVVIGFILNCALVVWLLTHQIERAWRMMMSSLASVFGLLLFIPVVVILSPLQLPLFDWLPIGLWIVTSAFYSYHIIRQPQLTITRERYVPIISTTIVISIVCLTILIGFLPRYLNYFLTSGDTLRYVYGSMYLYDFGYWPISAVAEQQGSTALISYYPPGPNVLFSLSLWLAHTPKNQMFFPSSTTTQVLVIYALLTIFVQAMFVTCSILLLRVLAPQRWWWLIAPWFLYCLIPSVHGTPSGADGLMWPLFGLSLIAGWLWYSTKHWLSAVFIGCTIAISSVTKQEGPLLMIMFVTPWLVLSWLEHKSPAWRKVILAVAVGLLPYIAWTIQKKLLGIHSVVYQTIQLKQAIVHFETLYDIIKTVSSATFNDRSGWVILLGLILLLAYRRSTNWHGLLASLTMLLPVPIYLAGMTLIYLFSTEPNVQIMINVSWSRLLIYPALYVTAVGLIILTQRTNQSVTS